MTIAVVTIAFWLALALPEYADYVTRSHLREAHTVLLDLREEMERHFEMRSGYVGGACRPTGLAAEQGNYFDYSCAPGEPTTTTFTLLARAKPGTDLEGLTYSVNEADARTTTIALGSTMATEGYPADSTCWVTRRSGHCLEMELRPEMGAAYPGGPCWPTSLIEAQGMFTTTSPLAPRWPPRAIPRIPLLGGTTVWPMRAAATVV